MKTFQVPVTIAASLVFAALCAAPASARCVYKKGQFRTPKASPLLSVAKANPLFTASADPGSNDAAPEPSITGYWYSRFLAGDQLVDDGFDVWLSDGMEILNDTTIPSQGNVCLGTWVRTAPYTFSLKHPSWIYDDAGVNLIGVVIIREQVTLDKKGANYSGDYTVDAYDLAGNLLEHLAGALTGERMAAVDDPKTMPAGGIPGLPLSILNR
jgi:hypothetical protein